MSQDLRTQISKAKRIVVKVGSSSLTTAQGGIDTQRVSAIVDSLAKHKNAGHEIVLVSDDVIFSEGALRDFIAGPATGKGATAVARESEVGVSA